jgi:hypothetical protein
MSQLRIHTPLIHAPLIRTPLIHAPLIHAPLRLVLFRYGETLIRSFIILDTVVRRSGNWEVKDLARRSQVETKTFITILSLFMVKQMLEIIYVSMLHRTQTVLLSDTYVMWIFLYSIESH